MRPLPFPRVVISLLILAALPAWGDTPEDFVRRYLAHAYDGRFDALLKSPDARTTEFERRARNLLRTRCVRTDGIALSVVEENAQQVTLHADVAITKSEIRNPQSSFLEIVPLRVELVREGETWLVDEVQNRDAELAARMLAGEQPDHYSVGLGRALYARAIAYLNLGKFKEAAAATEMARQVAVAVGDRGGEALALGAATYTTADGTRLSAESLAIAETLSDPDILARAWYDLGRSIRTNARLSNRVVDAADCYRNAREFAERAEDPAILTRILYSLANLAANAQSDNLSARRYIDAGLPLARELGDAKAEMAFEMVLSTVYLEQGDYERGLFHHKRATELAEKTGAYAYPTLLVRSGCLLADGGRFDEARASLEGLITRNENGVSIAIGSVPGKVVGSALRCLAVVEAESGNFNDADCLNREAARHDGTSPGAYAYELAWRYFEQGRPEAALGSALASLSGGVLDPNERVAALVAAGHAYRQMGNIEPGLAAAFEAIEIREAIDSRVAGDEQQRAFSASRTSECYELAAELLLDRGDSVEALAFLERGRARVLTDILDNGRPGTAAELDAAVRKQEGDLDREVARISQDLDRARAANDEKRIGAFTEQLSRARATRASFLDGLRARGERRDATRRLIDAAEIQRLATRLPARTIAIEYFVGERDLHIFVIGAGGVIVRTKRLERNVLDERASEFVEMLAQRDLRVEAAGRQLHALLIGPIEKEIASADALLVVPDDGLWRVPFAALVDRRGRYLVESKTIVYAPSLTTWSSITDSRRRREPSPTSLLAIGNPTLDPSARTAAASLYRGTTLGPLPDAEHEVDALGTLYDLPRSLVLKRDQATEGRTKAALRQVSIAHFATHAILDDANPMYSRLMLARDESASEDGWLESWEVARMDLDAELVVLSACETARGKVGGGEGVVGLSWAFFVAGASSTVATQWKVASGSTAELMIAFHRALRAPATNPALHKAQSLRAAQLQLIRDKRTQHPFHWAPFVLLGDASAGH